MISRSPLVLAAALGLSIAAAHAPTTSRDLPVQAGADGPELDACSRLAAVTGLDRKGDDFLAVRSGPGDRPYREIDRIHTGQRLSVRETRGPRFGVVYADRDGRDRGVATPWPHRTAYAGPCRSGWVPRRDVADRAGWAMRRRSAAGRAASCGLGPRPDPARTSAADAYPPFASRKNAAPMARRLRETQPQVVAPTPSSSVRRWATCANIAAQ